MALRPFDNRFKPTATTVNVIFMNGGVGDHVGSLVAVEYMIKHYKWINYLIWVPDYLVDFAKNVLPGNASVRSYSAMKMFYNRNITTLTTQWDGRTSPMKIHSVDYAFLKLCDENPEVEHKNYPKIKLDKVDLGDITLPEKYVVVTTGYTAPVREFKVETINSIIDYLLKKGLTPVFLGQANTKTGSAHTIKGTFNKDIEYDKGLNLIDKTSLLQAAKIMQGAKAVIGVDNGLMHVAGCTDVPIVGGFTTVTPELRAPIRDGVLGKDFYPVVPETSLSCRFCQVKTNFLYGHDYKYCMYKDYECVSQLTAIKFIEQLEKFL